MTDLATRLKQEREALGLSQAELARAAHVSRQNIQHFESGRTKTPDAVKLFQIADALGVNARWLLLGAPPKARLSRYSAEAFEVAEIFDSLEEHQKVHVRNAFVQASAMGRSPTSDITP